MHGQVAPVGLGVQVEVLPQNAPFKNPGVIGKKAEKQPHQIQFQGVPGVAVFLQAVVQPAHQFGGFYVYGVFLFVTPLFIAGNKAEQMHLVNQVG